MNIASAQMLQDSLQNLGNTFARQKQMQIEQAFREAQMAHFNQMEAKQNEILQANLAHQARMENAESDKNNRLLGYEKDRLDLENKNYNLSKSVKQLDEAQKMAQDATNTLQNYSLQLSQDVMDGKITPDQATQQFKSDFNDATKDNPFMLQKMLGIGRFNDLYNGRGDWAQLKNDILAEQAKAQAAQQAQAEANAPKDKIVDEEQIPAVQPDPGSPAISHWFSKDTPAVPPTPGSPAHKITRTTFVSSGAEYRPPNISPSDVNSQVQGAVSAPTSSAFVPGDGQTATNPKTGEKIIFKNGAWQPLAGSPSASAFAPALGSQPIRPMILPNGQMLQSLPQQQLDRYRYLRNKLDTLGADHVSADEAHEMTSLEKSLGLDFSKPVPDTLPQQPIQGGGGFQISMPTAMPPNYSGQ
jgi:hypothetical protein